MIRSRVFWLFPALLTALSVSHAQTAPGQPAAAPNLTITLQDAWQRAQKYASQLQAADIVAQLAREDLKQARAATLPQATALNQFIYTEGNGTPSGVFVANDGVHVYNEQLQVHEELLSFARRGEVRMAAAAEAVARARRDVAARGLRLTVAQYYFAIVSALRKQRNAQLSLTETREFLDITQKQERGGEVAHSDVIKAQLQVQQRERDVLDGTTAIQKAKITLGVLMFPTLNSTYDIVDDLDDTPALPALPDFSVEANTANPDIRAAEAAVNQAKQGVSVARYGYLPSLGLDVFYGINANQFAIETNHLTNATGRSTLPDYQVEQRRNLGYMAQATMNVPIWNWGAIHSKVKQASLRERQAELDLSLTRRQLDADILSAYQEAQTALSQVGSLRSSSELAAESLRLTLLRYKAGEATALEVVDAQTTANQARSAFDDGVVRYRTALTNLQTLTGAF